MSARGAIRKRTGMSHGPSAVPLKGRPHATLRAKACRFHSAISLKRKPPVGGSPTPTLRPEGLRETFKRMSVANHELTSSNLSSSFRVHHDATLCVWKGAEERCNVYWASTQTSANARTLSSRQNRSTGTLSRSSSWAGGVEHLHMPLRAQATSVLLLASDPFRIATGLNIARS